VAEALLTHLHHSLNRLSVHLNVNQVGCAREVVVPQPVVGHLKVPDALAGPRIQADQTVTKEAVAGTVDPVVIVRRRTERQVDVAQCFVRAHHRPNISCARRLPGIILPGLVPELSLFGDGMENPLQVAGANVEASHVPGRHHRSKWNVIDLRTHDYDIATDDRWGGNAVQMAIDTATKPLRQVDTPLVSEGGNGLARRGVQADQVAIAGAEQKPLFEGIPFFHVSGSYTQWVLPVAASMAATWESEVLIYSTPPTINGVDSHAHVFR
jgi:hypothetical protein